MQVWPALNHLPVASRGATRSMAISAHTIAGDLPPSSRVSGVRLGAAAAMTLRPTAVEPVNTRWSSGSAAKAAATSAPPVATATRSAGNTPVSSERRKAALRGVCSEGLRKTWLPAAIAVASGIRARLTG